MKRIILIRVPFFLLILLGMSCLSVHAGEEEKYYQLATALTKLSKAVEAVVVFDDPSSQTTGQELLSQATVHDRSLLLPFSSYSLQAVRQEGHAVLLVCTADGHQSLLEDVGCSAALDRHAWKNKPPQPCRLVIKVDRICVP